MNINYIKLLLWPGNSPGMNPTESLWDILKDEIHQVPITNTILLMERLIHAWFHFKKIEALCGSLISRHAYKRCCSKTGLGKSSKVLNIVFMNICRQIVCVNVN